MNNSNSALKIPPGIVTTLSGNTIVYHARVTLDKVRIHLGTYSTVEEASHAIYLFKHKELLKTYCFDLPEGKDIDLMSFIEDIKRSKPKCSPAELRSGEEYQLNKDKLSNVPFHELSSDEDYKCEDGSIIKVKFIKMYFDEILGDISKEKL